MNFEIAIGSRVSVKGENIWAQVTGIMLEAEGTQYRIVYWNEGTRICTWVHGFEIGETGSV